MYVLSTYYVTSRRKLPILLRIMTYGMPLKPKLFNLMAHNCCIKRHITVIWWVSLENVASGSLLQRSLDRCFVAEIIANLKF